jgi:uncharacterized protein (DUF1810 family)
MAAPEQPDNSDPYDLGRFLAAQRDTYADALAEIRAGRKRSHWMWFMFPQIQGLGFSENARYYAIANADEARAYLTHPVLGPRLLEITGALLGVEGKSAHEILGSPDDMKLRSSATLFASILPPGSVFEQILTRFFSGQPDPETIRRLARP